MLQETRVKDLSVEVLPVVHEKNLPNKTGSTGVRRAFVASYKFTRRK